MGHHERADADAAHGEPRSEPTASDEPSRHRAHGRNIRTADAQADAEPVSRTNLRQVPGHAGGGKPNPGQDHADDSETPGAPAIGERSGYDPKSEVQKTGKREDERNRTPRSGEIMLQRKKKSAERIRASEADKSNGERSRDNKPTVKDPRL